VVVGRMHRRLGEAQARCHRAMRALPRHGDSATAPAVAAAAVAVAVGSAAAAAVAVAVAAVTANSLCG
jgi:hypothetical protein